MKKLEELSFDNSYGKLPEIFYSRHGISPLQNLHVISVNPSAADLINLSTDEFEREDFARLIVVPNS